MFPLIDCCYNIRVVCFINLQFSLSLSRTHIHTHTYTQTHTTSAASAAPLSYLTRPENVSVAVGEPAVFQCGVPESSSNVIFHFYGDHGTYSITCPYGQVEDIPHVSCLSLLKGLMCFMRIHFCILHPVFPSQALYGSCNAKNGELMASWTLKGTSFSDNGTSVTCQGSMSLEAPAAFLHVYGKDSDIPKQFSNRFYLGK